MAAAAGFSQEFKLPTSTVELTVQCDKLKDKDILSKSDPCCVLFKKVKGRRDDWIEVDRTEVVKNDLNPVWQKRFVMEYSFEERQELKFEVYDADSNSADLKQHDFLGRCETSLGQIVSSPNHLYISTLKHGKGRISVNCEELKSCKEILKIQFAAEHLDKKDFLGKSDPFLVIRKSSPANGQFITVKKTEVIKNTLKPTWAPFSISLRELCNGDYDRNLKFDVYDWDSDGTHDLIGSFSTNLKTLQIAAIEKTKFACINEKKKASKKSYKNSGEVYVKNVQIEEEVTFLDYIQGGTSMNFSVAVDFTASNGNPADPSSLHHLKPGLADNQYSTAIKSVGSIIEDYDSDKLFPGLGFGARVPPNMDVSHEFFLNLHPDNPYCQGVDGLLQAYFASLQSVRLYGPTNFAPVIRHVSRFAQAYQDGRQYFVLLIITDGIITDMDETKLALIAASSLPMSVIIVGVGQEDFSAMEALDADDTGVLRFAGKLAVRDIVQFVEMRKFVRSSPGSAGDVWWDKETLAKEVLAEIPKQLTGWMKRNGIKPIPSPGAQPN